ncbi:general substrate transporter [Artomyces pyxidatus]|uniref:General substrate transporter n=1 Tax=Artomyces pyxidatus TaxID=48021 RepID=A0ACB8SQ75_9AGAM|nr:general substrate transporter [Artomyces pyxidatus]
MTHPSHESDGYSTLPSSSEHDPPLESHGEEDASTTPLLSSHSDLRGGTLTVHPDGETYSYAYGPPGLAGLMHNSYGLGCAVFASLGGLTFGYDQGVIANVLVMKDFVERWPVSAWETGLMTAVLELGCLFGALLAGVLADRISRRGSIAIACVVFCTGSALQCWAESLTQITVGRAIGGFGVGALSMLSPLYMAEISPPELRGSLMALEQFSIVLGCVIGFWTGFFTRSIPGSRSWRIPLGLQLIPGIFLGCGTYFLPPSPRLLIMQGKREAALASLARLRLRPLDVARQDPLVLTELLEMEVEVTLLRKVTESDGKNVWRNEALAWARLFDPRYIDRTWVGVLIMFFQQWSGINALIYYGPSLMRSLGLNGDSVNLLVAGGINIVQFLAVFPAILYIDEWGRKPLLRVGSATMAAAHLLIALLVFQFEGRWQDHVTAAWLAVGCVYIFTASYGMSFGPVGWVLPSEVFPLTMRGKGVSLSTASNWLNNFLIGLVTPALMEASPSITFGVFACACFAAYLWSTYVVPETANVSLEMIDEVFNSSAGREDMLLKKQVERDLGLYDWISGISELRSIP